MDAAIRGQEAEKNLTAQLEKRKAYAHLALPRAYQQPAHRHLSDEDEN